MKGDIRFSIAGMILLLALAGCGRGSFQFGERAAWRHEAEVTCLKSGKVKLGSGVVQIEPIEGSGMCGADFPLKVATLRESPGEYSPRLGYADEQRPPGTIVNGQPSRLPQRPVNYDQPSQTGSMRWIAGPSGIDRTQANTPAGQPLSLQPSAEAPVETERGHAEPHLRSSYNVPVYSGPRQQIHVSPAIGSADGRQMALDTPVALSPPATLACPMVPALDRWVSEGVQPAALRWFGVPVVKIQQISAYSCRAMVGAGTSKISEHAFGNALDVAGFTLTDGRTITFKDGWHGTPEVQGFLHDVQLYACEIFTTVLAPGYNVYHYNHIHLDLMRRDSGQRPCRPEAISGEVAAARARAQYAHHHGPAYATSVGMRDSRPLRGALAGEDGFVEDDRGG